MSRNTRTFKDTVDFIRDWYQTQEFIPLHVPVFPGKEKEYLNECIDSTFVSSVGKFVTEAEEKIAEIVGAKYAVAAVNGTSALHLALRVAGVEAGDEVITQPLTFVATCNSIRYLNAEPVFVDVSPKTLGLSAEALKSFLEEETEVKDGACYNKQTGSKIAACCPMHTFGHPVELDEIKQLCDEYHIALVEDAAESLGSYYKGKHVGNHGLVSAFSFNGNKIITSGGGGMLVTNDEKIAKHAKHLSTVAKTAHAWDFYHDEMGYNYRMPNVNAALLLGQLEQLENFLANKRKTAEAYQSFYADQEDVEFFKEPAECRSNYWLNVVMLENREARDQFLKTTNEDGVMTRPAWILMPDLPEYKNCQVHSSKNSREIADRLVNIPSSVKL